MSVTQSAATGYGPWFHYVVRRDAPRLRLVCLAGAGSGPSEFTTWGQALPTDVEIWPVQLPGRERRLRETPWTDLPALVSALDTALAATPGDTRIPLVLFGHSFGALVMFDWCRRLAQQDRPVAGLVVSGLAAPDRPGLRAAVSDRDDPALLDWIRHLGGTPTELLDSPGFASWLLRDIRAAYHIRDEYRYLPTTLAHPLTVFGGHNDFETSTADLDAWSRFTSSRFRRHLLPGGHFYLRVQRGQFLELLASELTAMRPGRES